MNLSDQKIEELFKRINQKLVNPWFLSKCKELVKNCAARGAVYYAIQGTRTWDEQQKLYNQGRNAKGEVIDKSKVVTKAKPGLSFHNYGIAIDFCLDKDLETDGLQPDWDTKNYKVLGEEALKLGLDAGIFWKSFVDAPHIQVPESLLKITSVLQLKSLYEKRGQKGVDEFLASKLPPA